MAAIGLLSQLIGVSLSELSKEEVFILEAELFSSICEELREYFRNLYKSYSNLMQLTWDQENKMLDNIFLSSVIKDIISTGEYSLSGVAYYIDSHEDVIQEVIDGRNSNPSALLLRKSIDLHRSVRRDLYQDIMKRIVMKYQKAS